MTYCSVRTIQCGRGKSQLVLPLAAGVTLGLVSLKSVEVFLMFIGPCIIAIVDE